MTKEEVLYNLIKEGYVMESFWGKDFGEIILQIKAWRPYESQKVFFAKRPIEGGNTIHEAMKRTEHFLLNDLYNRIYEEWYGDSLPPGDLKEGFE